MNSKKKPNLPKKSKEGKLSKEFLEKMQQEDEMIDDHGQIIVGDRVKKPVLPNKNKKKDK